VQLHFLMRLVEQCGLLSLFLMDSKSEELFLGVTVKSESLEIKFVMTILRSIIS